MQNNSIQYATINMNTIYQVQCKDAYDNNNCSIDNNNRKYDMNKLTFCSKTISNNNNHNSNHVNYHICNKYKRKRFKVIDLLNAVIDFFIGPRNHINNLNKNHLYNYRNDGPYRQHPFMCFLSIWSCLSLITTITITSAAPQGCILCDSGDLKGKYHQHNYEEFRYEHQVTRQDAIAALRQLNDSFYEGSSMDNSCNSIRCTNKVMKYCFNSQFINDHCLCELAHNVEGLPFVPHICYVGEKAHKPSVGSCFLYEEVKDCCCAPALATQWRHISMASKIKVSYIFYLIFISACLW